MDDLKFIINFAKTFNKIDDNSYFKKLKEKPDLQSFLKSQEGFVSAVDNWSKMLGCLLSKVPSYKERKPIIDNLYDEHGDGDLSKSHVNTFVDFLKSLGHNGKVELYADSPSYKHVKVFNNGLKDALINEDWVFCAAALGMIEYTYVKVSKNIHEYATNFIESDVITHYSIHETVDVKHAKDLFETCVPHVKTNSEEILEGMKYGYNLMNDFYEGVADLLESTSSNQLQPLNKNETHPLEHC